jgi:hypothetical protein
MAEATERPAEDKGAITPIPPAPPPAADEAPRTYSSVSVLAVIGFAVAIVYAAVICIGAPIAFFYHVPWILPAWTFVFPVAAAVVSWAARVRIRNSEGALTGTRLTTWGAGLSVVVGLIYGAYDAGTYLAISSQGKAAADQWMELLRKGQYDQAFRLTLPPPRPADDENLRDRLEMDFDRGPEGRGGLLTNFRQSELVRQFEQGDAQFQFLGVQSWGYDKGAYQVELSYRVTTPAMTSEMLVTAFGVDNADESGERQWVVKDPRPLKDPVLSDEGVRMSIMDGQARRFGQMWLDKLSGAGGKENEENAYLDTLPYAERVRQRKERGQAFDEGLKAFQAGAVVHADPDTFWVGQQEKDPERAKARRQRQQEIADRVRGLFAPGKARGLGLMLGMSRPIYRHDSQLARLGYDMTIMLEGLKVESRLQLAADTGDGDPKEEQWRVESLDLLSAKSTAGATGGAPGPRRLQPGGRP